MRTVLKIATVLTWINMVIGGLLTIGGLYVVLMSQNLSMLIGAFLVSSVVLHSFAALQLRRSIVNPSRPLSGQTPTGIRFIGVVALFFGMLYFASGIALLQNPGDFIKMMQSDITEKMHYTLPQIRVGGLFILLVGFSIALNVMLNFRLLRWYYFMKGMM